jgi:uncharacterized protein YcaQ
VAALPAPVASLTADDARRLALRAQGLLGAPNRRGGVPALLRHLGAIQLDTISVLARSHELVPYARLGAIGRAAVESAYWGHRPARAFEYWSHAACVLPVEEWPWFAFRRREFRRRGLRWHTVPEQVGAQVLARLRADGPLTATDLGGAKREGTWWSWSAVKIAVEWLLDIGEVVCTERRGWRRVYDLPERALPTRLLDSEPSDGECLQRLVGLAGWSLGVADVADLADYHRLTKAQVSDALEGSGLLPVSVQGWSQPGWADPAALDVLQARGRHRTTLLSPFDSLVWDRRRTLRIFGFVHALEAYKSRADRRYGYYAMPLLSGGQLLGRVDPKRVGRTLLAQQVTLDRPRAVAPMAQALREAATWVGCDDVRVDRVEPQALAPPLQRAVQ